ncbi:hypothetical protein X737_19820 [Mesorhizobium sp. L48C026A00]|nr:hypothetical protein X737_19820 [Mesorhizobium sp. L48C026A00]
MAVGGARIAPGDGVVEGFGSAARQARCQFFWPDSALRKIENAE